MKRLALAWWIGLFGLALSAPGCGGSDAGAALVGSWQDHDNPAHCTYTFRPDATFDNGSCGGSGTYDVMGTTLALSFYTNNPIGPQDQPFLRLDTAFYNNGAQLGFEVFTRSDSAPGVVCTWTRTSILQEINEGTGEITYSKEIDSRLQFSADGVVTATADVKASDATAQSIGLMTGTYTETQGPLLRYDLSWQVGNPPPGTVATAFLIDQSVLAQLVLWKQ